MSTAHTDDKAAAERFRFTLLQARAKKAGHTLTRSGTGYVLARWTYSKHASDLDAVEALLARMTGRAA